MRPQHTPGPWDIHTNARGGLEIHPLWDEHGERTIADIIGTMPLDEANARLIAAAPDLLEALEAVVSNIDYERGSDYDTSLAEKILLQTRSAIAKAKGEKP